MQCLEVPKDRAGIRLLEKGRRGEKCGIALQGLARDRDWGRAGAERKRGGAGRGFRAALRAAGGRGPQSLRGAGGAAEHSTMAGSLRASLPPMTTLALVLALTLALALRGGALAAGPAKSPRLVGGPLEADGNSEDVRRMLDFAVREYNQMSNDRFLHRPVALVRARKQVGRAVRSCPGVAAPGGRGGA